jgi:hypothetical protein
MRSDRLTWVKVKVMVMAAAAWLAIVGCGGSGGIPADQIGAELHQAGCRWRVRCGLMPDVDTCLAATRSPLTPQMSADLASGRVSYDAAAGQRLVTMIDGRSCLESDLGPNGSAVLGELEATAAAFRGTVPPGGACFVDGECASGNCDAPGVEGCPQGKCVAPPTAPAVPSGGACTPNASVCATGTVCGMVDPTTLMGTCAAPATAGQHCDDSYYLDGGCAPGLECVGNNGVGTQFCQAHPASGASCDPSSFVECDEYSDTCDPATHTCQPQLPVGTACSTNGIICGNDSYCDSSSGTCRAKLELGAPCPAPGADAFSTCLGDLQCDAGTHTCQFGPDVPACQ